MKVVGLAEFSSTCEEGTHHFSFPLPLVDVADSLSVSPVLLSLLRQHPFPEDNAARQAQCKGRCLSALTAGEAPWQDFRAEVTL